MKKLLLLLLLAGCEKEPDSYVIKHYYPIEGTYKGAITMKCDSFPYDMYYRQAVLQIACFDGEKIVATSNCGTGEGHVNGDHYDYAMDIVDDTNCGLDVAIELQVTGTVSDSVLTEGGRFVLVFKEKAYSGVYKSNMIKQPRK